MLYFAIMSKIFPEMESEFSKLLTESGISPINASEQLGISLRTIYRWQESAQPSSPAYRLAVKYLKEISGKTINILGENKMYDFTYIDLFAGIGGFRKAFDSINGQCVFTSEWDRQSRMTYQANYDSSHEIAGDIRDFTINEETLSRIPRHDVLVAGFPCQPFSIAGVSKKNSLGKAHGFMCDTQGTLFFDLAQIIAFHRPAVFLLENVKNLISHDGGKTFRTIKGTLEEELGYNISYRIIDGKSWVPQHRERIFITGTRKDLDIDIDLKNMEIPDVKKGPRLDTILHEPGLEEDEIPYYVNGRVADKYTLSAQLWDYLQKYKEKHAAKGNGFGYSLFDKNDVSRTLSARYYKDGSEILIRQENSAPRRLTPRECARLMGFDTQSGAGFVIPVSDTQAYRQFGNSVIVPCAKTIAAYMKPAIISAVRKKAEERGSAAAHTQLEAA